LGEAYLAEHPWASTGDYVRLRVSDTGSGMPPEVVERVFEPFFTTKEIGKGTGMGLATVYGIVKQHNGFIDVDSEPGVGTTFDVYLPAVDSESDAYRETAGEKESAQGGSETILLAEDEEIVRNSTAEMLRRNGYRVLVACDGQEAINLFEEHGDEIALFLLDVIMPRKGGRAVFDRIKAAKPSARVLFSSGYSHRVLETSSLPEQGYELVQKPYNPDDLLRAIRKLLDATT